MRPSVLLALLALPLAACLDSGAEGGIDAAYRGTLRVEVVPLNLAGIGTAVVDVAAGPDAGDDGWTRERTLWVPSVSPTAVASIPCDARLGPHRVEVHVVGVFEEVLDDAGGFGDTLATGLPYQDPGTLLRDATCVAGVDTLVHLDVALMKPAEQGFFDIAVQAYGDDAIRDGVWRLRVMNGETPPRMVWEQAVQSSIHGDGHGALSFVGPCDAAPGAEDNALTAELVGLYGEAQGYDGITPIITSEPLELWPPPTLTTTVTCRLNQDVFIQLETPIARVIRTADDVRARFAGLTCAAAWNAGMAGHLRTPHLVVMCESTRDTPPVLDFDDLRVHCAGADTLTVPLGDDVATSLSAFRDGSLGATWFLFPDPSALPTGDCTLEAHARVRAEDEALPSGDAASVYPEIVWSFSVSNAEGLIPGTAYLDVDGPVRVGYVAADTPYAHTLVATSGPGAPPRRERAR
ncbi:MAG: hypothetical protein EP329_28625 [Deltaproteobacteria bacterium]|nr:MAG: hypothetical protein EP329_28625 [Deltaproteobacteria bacterium]